MNQQYRHKNTSVSLVNYHFAKTPRRRRKVLVGNVDTRLKELIPETAFKLDCHVLVYSLAATT